MKLSSNTIVLIVTGALTLLVACIKEKNTSFDFLPEETPWVFPTGLEKNIQADCFALQTQDVQFNSGLLEFRDVPTFQKVIQSLSELSTLNSDFLSLRNNLSTLEPLTGKSARYPALKAFEKRFPGFQSGFFRTRINEPLTLTPHAVHTRQNADLETPLQVVFNLQREIKVGKKIFRQQESGYWLLINDGDMTTLNFLRTEPSRTVLLSLSNVHPLPNSGAFSLQWLKENEQ